MIIKVFQRFVFWSECDGLCEGPNSEFGLKQAFFSADDGKSEFQRFLKRIAVLYCNKSILC